MPAEYATTPLARKLGIKPGHRVRLHRAPVAWSIPSLPSDVRVVRRTTASKSDVVVAFFFNLAQLQHDAAALTAAITATGALWIAWPRRAGGHSSDITDNAVRDVILPLGLVDVKVAALDDDWSSLKMVWRVERRAGVA